MSEKIDEPITNEAQAQEWLNAGAIGDRFEVEYLDELQRIARITRPKSGEERWEHLYGCWQQVKN